MTKNIQTENTQETNAQPTKKKSKKPLLDGDPVEVSNTEETAPESPNDARLRRMMDNGKHQYFLKTLVELAIPYKLLEFKCKRDGTPSSGLYMTPDKDGNVQFYTPTYDGDIETYTTDTTNVKVHDWYLTRFNPPKVMDGEEIRYMPVRGGGTRLMMTEPVVRAYSNKEQVETLFLIEGFKKAHSLAYHSGLPVIGMNGLTGFKEPSKEKIRSELKEVLKRLEPKRVVLIFDSDLFDIGSGKKDPESARPNNFFRAALAAKAYIEPFSDVVLVHPKPDPKQKFGFDDLMLHHRENEFTKQDLFLDQVKPDAGHKKVIDELLLEIESGESKLFGSLRLSSVADHRIREYFHLVDVMAFYQFHIEKLKGKRQFRFYTHTYKIKEDGTLDEVKENETYGYKIRNNSIYKPAKDKEELVSNFTMKILFHVQGDENRRVAELLNYNNERAVVEVTADDFSSPQRFLSLGINQGDFVFYGGREDLLKITGMMIKHEKRATVISTLGYQPETGVWAYSNGISTADGWKPCDEFGIVEHNDEYFYFPAFSKFNARKKETFSEERKHVHIPTEKTFTFEQWKKQFVKVYEDNGEITVCYYLAALFSDIVFNHKSGIGFPILFASGRPKTGKSTIFQSLLCLFGEGLTGESLSSNSTFKYLFTQLAKVRNGMVFFDEYSNDIPKIFDFLKNIFDRRPYGTKQYSNDNKTRIVPIHAAVCVAGEVLPTGNHALFTRTISMMFSRTEEQRTDAERDEFRKLSQMEETGLTSITVALSRARHHIEANFDKTYNVVSSEVDALFKGSTIDGRMKKSAKWILTVVRVLIDEKVIDYGTDFKDLLKVWYSVLKLQNAQIQTNTDTAKFWAIFDRMNRNGFISEDAGDFKFDGEMLVLRLSRIVIPYQKMALELKESKILDKSSLKNYLENEPYFVPMLDGNGRQKQTRFAGSTPVEGLWLDYQKLMELYEIDLTRPRISPNVPEPPQRTPPRQKPEPDAVQTEFKPDTPTDDLPF